MGEMLRVLMIEDCEDDALLLLRELREGGFSPLYNRVDNSSDMRGALAGGSWDIILADHRMPNFSAPAALNILQESGMDIPFIIVSGSIGETLAVEAMKSGASDYVMKDNRSRLIPAIKRSLKEAGVRQERREAEQALRESEEKFRALFNNATDVICLYRLLEDGRPGSFMEVNEVACRKMGYSRSELLNMTPLHLIAGEDRPRLQSCIKEGIQSNGHITFETIFVTKASRQIPFEVSSHVFFLKGLMVVLSICRDITERKRAENELRQSVQMLRRSMEGVIMITAKTVEVRDPYTAGHQRSVSRLAGAIAEEMGLPDKEIEGIRLACEIHDLGKIYIPAEILSKPGKISDIEYDMIRTHPKVGHDILKTIEFPWPIASIVAQHHERMDGSGYPHGLSGEEITIGARILGVADVVEAMASHRPYRPALGVEKALEEILRNDKRLYDHNVVEACLRLFKDNKFDINSIDNAGAE